MIKAIIGVAITLLICILGGLVLGFWKLFEIAPFWLSITSLSVFAVLVIVLAVLIVKLIADVKAWIKSLEEKLTAWVAGLPSWVKKLLGIK